MSTLTHSTLWLLLLAALLSFAACTMPMLDPQDGTLQPAAAPPEREAIAKTIATIAPTPTCCPSPIAFSLPTGTSPVDLLEPVDGTEGNGELRFVWQSNIELPEGTAYELIFWREGDNPLLLGFGIHQPVTETELIVDLTMIDVVLSRLFDPGDYHWGIMLVDIDPFHRRQLLSEPFRFTYAPEPGQVPQDTTLGE